MQVQHQVVQGPEKIKMDQASSTDTEAQEITLDRLRDTHCKLSRNVCMNIRATEPLM